MRWKTFLKAHWGALVREGLLTVEILTMLGLVPSSPCLNPSYDAATVPSTLGTAGVDTNSPRRLPPGGVPHAVRRPAFSAPAVISVRLAWVLEHASACDLWAHAGARPLMRQRRRESCISARPCVWPLV
jgi:hypothetical protein